MAINLGSGAITAAKIGSTDVAKLMLGSTEVYAAGGDSIDITGGTLAGSLALSTGAYESPQHYFRWGDSGGYFYAGARKVSRYDLTTAYDLATATINTSESFTYSADAYAFAIKPDGLKFYMGRASGGTVFAGTMSQAWSLSSYSGSSTATFGTSVINGIAFNSDGTKLFLVRQSSVEEYGLSTAWDITTATLSNTLSVSTVDAGTTDIAFSSDGSQMFLTGNGNDSVFGWELSTAYDLSSATYSQALSLGTEDGYSFYWPTGLDFSGDATSLYVTGGFSKKVYRYAL